MSDMIVYPSGVLVHAQEQYSCTVGRGGVSLQKSEGDGATPAGRFALRYVLYRADKLQRPATKLALHAIAPDDGWCDDPADAAYNTPVKLPYPARFEHMWRDDNAYDIVVVIGYNDAPVIAGRGSAIFMHLLHDDHRPTAGCVALSLDDMLRLLAALDTTSYIDIRATA